MFRVEKIKFFAYLLLSLRCNNEYLGVLKNSSIAPFLRKEETIHKDINAFSGMHKCKPENICKSESINLGTVSAMHTTFR